MAKEFSGPEVEEILHYLLSLLDDDVYADAADRFECSVDEVKDIVERAKLHADSVTL